MFTTSTTVGYGNMYATSTAEKTFLVFLEFTGICIFSIITGNIRSLKYAPNIKKVV